MASPATQTRPDDYPRRVVFGGVLLLSALWLNYIANGYAAAHPGPMVPDTLLGWLPVVNVNLFFSEGSYLVIAGIIVISVVYWQRIPFILKSLALLIAIRAIFLSVTHLGVIEPHSGLDGTFPRFFSQGHDYFFSGHTSLPFLFALVFWDKRKIRAIFLIITVIAAATVLLGHLHYSIDVLAAPFMTYAIYQLAIALFSSDFRQVRSS